MAQITVNRLKFDITANDRETALDFQNRLSASSENVAACLESTLEPYDDPDCHLVLDRLQLDLEALDLEYLEEDLLRSIRKNLKLQLEILPERAQKNPGQNRTEIVISKETIQQYEQKQIRYFLETGHSIDHSTKQLISKAQIKKVLSDNPSVGKWLISAQEEKPEVLTRLLFHLDDAEIHPLLLGSSFIDRDVLTELITAMVSIDANGSETKARLSVWKHLFIQKSEGITTFNSPAFFKSIERQHSFPPHKYLRHLSQQIQDKLISENHDFFSPFLGTLPDSPSTQASDGRLANRLDRSSEAETDNYARFEAHQEENFRLEKTSHVPEGREPIDPLNQLKFKGTPSGTQQISEENYNEHLADDTEHIVPKQSVETPASICGAKNSEDIASASDSREKERPVNSYQLKQESDNNLSKNLESNSEKTSCSECASIYLLEHEEPEIEKDTRFHLHNAGIVMTAPFLGNFFKHLGLLEQDKFVNKEAQQRAVVLLHYFYPQCEITEDALLLHKILCGLPIKHPVPVNLEPRENELTEINNLLQSIIQYWGSLKNTSVEALKFNFFNRKAILVPGEAQWHLTIQRESIDVLLQTLPWSIEVIKHPWMKKPIMVEW